VVAVAVGGLVDLLTRQGVQAARARAEAENLARLAADSLAAPRQLAAAIASVRQIFDLDGAAILHRTAAGWQVEAAEGKTRLEHPDVSGYCVELADDRVLALAGSRLSEQDATLLRVFLGQFRLARERAALEALRNYKRPATG